MENMSFCDEMYETPDRETLNLSAILSDSY